MNCPGLWHLIDSGHPMAVYNMLVLLRITIYIILSLLTSALLTALSFCSPYYSHVCKSTLQFHFRIKVKLDEHFRVTS